MPEHSDVDRISPQKSDLPTGPEFLQIPPGFFLLSDTHAEPIWQQLGAEKAEALKQASLELKIDYQPPANRAEQMSYFLKRGNQDRGVKPGNFKSYWAIPLDTLIKASSEIAPFAVITSHISAELFTPILKLRIRVESLNQLMKSGETTSQQEIVNDLRKLIHYTNTQVEVATQFLKSIDLRKLQVGHSDTTRIPVFEIYQDETTGQMVKSKQSLQHILQTCIQATKEAMEDIRNAQEMLRQAKVLLPSLDVGSFASP